MKKSFWWAIQASYWFWRLAGISVRDAVWHGFNMRAVYNGDATLLADESTVSDAVSAEISEWYE